VCAGIAQLGTPVEVLEINSLDDEHGLLKYGPYTQLKKTYLLICLGFPGFLRVYYLSSHSIQKVYLFGLLPPLRDQNLDPPWIKNFIPHPHLPWGRTLCLPKGHSMSNQHEKIKNDTHHLRIS
jgi:hypothetical protein